MPTISNKGRLLISLVLVFGILAYLVQGEKQGMKQAGVINPSERPIQQVHELDEVLGATKVNSELDPKAEDILQEASNKAEGGTSFFIEYRLERDRQRSQQIDLLKQIVDSPNSSGESRKEAEKRLVELTQQMDLEMQLEKLIVAKGYKDAAVFIQPKAVNVIVMADKFDNEDANIIGDLVYRATGRPREQISMIHKK
ncbi:MAG: stage sporulation protein [Clostridia bacterium]|nr:stage sporulation protein [Clostridia bacterium]